MRETIRWIGGGIVGEDSELGASERIIGIDPAQFIDLRSDEEGSSIIRY